MTIPSYSALKHWYASPRQTSALSTRIDDFSGKGNHGSRIGTVISIISGWFNLGEAGGNNGIQPPTLSTNGWGSYTWIARVRRSSASNWPTTNAILGGLTGGTQGVVTYFDGTTLRQVHNNFGFNSGLNINISGWTVDDDHVVAVVYDSSAQTLKAYLDGTETASLTGVTANTGAGNFAWFVWNGGQSFAHEADNLMLWSGTGAALSSSDVATATAYFDLSRSSFTPADGAVDVATNTTLTISFSTPPHIGTGALTVVETGVGNFEVIDITDAGQVSVSGNDLIVTLSSSLAGSTAYHVLLDAGAILGDPGIADATTWNFVTESTGMQGDAAMVLAASATLTGAGALTGGASQVLTGSGTLTGSGALASGATLELTATGAMSGVGALAGDAPLVLALSGTLGGTGTLSGSADQSLVLSGSLTATGALSGAAAQVLTLAGTLTGAGALSGDSPLLLDVTGTLSLPPGSMQGDAAMALQVSGTLTGHGALSGAAEQTLLLAGTLAIPAVSRVTGSFSAVRAGIGATMADASAGISATLSASKPGPRATIES